MLDDGRGSHHLPRSWILNNVIKHREYDGATLNDSVIIPRQADAAALAERWRVWTVG